MSLDTIAVFGLKCILATIPTVIAGCVLLRLRLLESSLVVSILIGGVGAIFLTYVTRDISVHYLTLGALLLPIGMYKTDLWNIYLRGKSPQYKLFLIVVVTVFSAIIITLGFLFAPHG